MLGLVNQGIHDLALQLAASRCGATSPPPPA
jgi:hypothetical protein